MATFNTAWTNKDFNQMRDLYVKNKETVDRIFQMQMVNTLINFCLESKMISRAFSFIPELIRVKVPTSKTIDGLFNNCYMLPPNQVDRKMREQFIDYLTDIKFKVGGDSLKRNLDELLKKKEVTCLWKLLKYSIKLNDYKPSIKLCDWAIDQLSLKEDFLDVVLAHFYLLKEDVRKISSSSIDKLRVFTKKYGGSMDSELLSFLQSHKYNTAASRPGKETKIHFLNSVDEQTRRLWLTFATGQPNQQLLNDLVGNFIKKLSEVGQSFSSFYNFLKISPETTEPKCRSRLIAKLAFAIIMECMTRQEFELGHSVIKILFSDRRNYFELLETNDDNNFVTVFQMAMACVDICVRVNDDAFALEILKATDGALPSETNNDRIQRLRRLELLHILFKKYDREDPSLYANQVFLFECILQSNEKDSEILKHCHEAGHGVAEIFEKLMYRFIQNNIFKLAFSLYEKGNNLLLKLNEECYRGYLVLLKRNENHVSVSRRNFNDLLHLCQNKGLYPRFTGFEKPGEILIRSYYTVEEILVLLEIYIEKLVNFLIEKNQRSCKTIWIVIKQRPLITSLNILSTDANTLSVVDRVSVALSTLNLSLDMEADTCNNEPNLKIESLSLRCLIDKRIKEGLKLKNGSN